ncbi:MAG: hypothetical protein WD016_09980 [Balneolaceae bacterium]
MTFYKRNLPHWQPAGAEYFVTIRLANSLPKNVVDELIKKREEFYQKEGYKNDLRSLVNRRLFKKYESILDKAETGPLWLQNPEIADIVRSHCILETIKSTVYMLSV